MSTEINLDILDAPTSIMNQDDLDGDALAHFGIKGQKWGIRRYQNPDGSLTEAGKKRYGAGNIRDYRGKGRKRLISDMRSNLNDFLDKNPDKEAAWAKTADDLGLWKDHWDVLTDSHSADQTDTLMSVYEKTKAYKKEYGIKHADDTSDFLAHHGIKGQKWGNRRYQNSDGSLTPLGRLRYGVGAARNATGKAAKAAGKAIGKAARKATGMQTDEELDAELKKAQAKYDRAEKKQLIDKLTGKHKPIHKMSDRELNDYVNRLYQEKQAQALKKEIKENGRGFISKFAHNTMDNIAENTARGIGEGVKRGVSNALATRFEEAEKRKQAKKWDEYDEKNNADKVDAAKNRDKLSAARDKLELRALNGDADAAAILNTVAKSSRGNADKHSNTSATKDAVENARNSLELRAINGDKEALKTLRKVTDAKKGSKKVGGDKPKGDNPKGDNPNDNKKPNNSTNKPNNSTNKPNNQNDKQNTAQSTSNTSGKKSKKSNQQSTDSSEPKKSIIADQKAYEAAKRKAKEHIKKKASTPVSETRAKK